MRILNLNKYIQSRLFGQLVKISHGNPGKRYDVVYLCTKEKDYPIRRRGAKWVDLELEKMVGKEVVVEGFIKDSFILCTKAKIFERKSN